MLGLTVLFLMLPTGLRNPTVLGLSLFCGGSLSNLLDRIVLGGVVDFLHISWAGFQPYIFNLADIAIGAGIVVIILSMIFKFAKVTSLKLIERTR